MITPSDSSRSTRRFTAVADSPTSVPMSANVRLALSISNATILRSMVSKGRLSCTLMPIDCVLVARSLSTGNIRHMTATALPHDVQSGALLELDGASLTIRDALEVSRGSRTVQLSDRAAEAVRASCNLKHDLIAQEIPIYGVTTGFG